MSRRAPVPNLVIAQRVIDKMQAAVSRFLEDETGEAMVGLIMPPHQGEAVPTYYVLDTISPDDSAVRQAHTFQQGDAWQEDMMWWYRENWHVRRTGQQRGFLKPKPEWDAPLIYLGDWHKQPGYMIAPSGADLQTALDWLEDPESETDALLVPIVTLDHPATIDPNPAAVNYVVIPQGDGTAVRVDWWYVHRDYGFFQPVTPVIAEYDELPALAPDPWHLKDTARADEEFARLEDAGLAVTLALVNIDGQIPLRIGLSAARVNGGSRIYLLMTDVHYPATPPQMRLMPFVSMQQGQSIADLFGTWWKEAEPVTLPDDWAWSPENYLLDFIEAVEAHMGLYTPPVPAADEGQTQSTADATSGSPTTGGADHKHTEADER
ncbi:MAG: hypothetical protein ACOCXZ_02940 [Chloroflexota bacterium]